MQAEEFLSRLQNVRRTSRGWMALCPAHEDKTPSLSIREGEHALLLKCWAGCTIEEICAALGLRVTDLFFDSGLPRSQRSAPRLPKVDHVAVAFQFELAALDRRLRAKRIFEAANGLDLSTLIDADLERALAAVAQAHMDVERAELFEGVADRLRERDYDEKRAREQAPRVA